VGKTTVSAALAAAMARTAGRRVMVLTVDPARRLYAALGIRSAGPDAVVVPAARLRRAGIPVRGQLSAAMLDQKSAWDRMVERYAPDRRTARRILASRFYQGISDAFVGSHEYIAMESLYELHEAGEYDCVVVDTPPSRSTLDLLEAPERFSDFVGARLISWLARPSGFGFRAMNLAAAPLMHVADRLLGGDVVGELADFVNDLQSLHAGVQQRARAVGRLLRSSRVGFVVVTTPEQAACAEAEHFVSQLHELSMPLRAVVVNRVWPDCLTDDGAVRAAEAMVDDGRIAAGLGAALGSPVDAAALSAAGRSYSLLAGLAQRDARRLAGLRRLAGVAVTQVPLIPQSVNDLEGLSRVAAEL
jgi:anion-transporting  ArsA/GET3 family ATPase